MDGKQVLKFRVDGMDCPDEMPILRRAVGPVVGGEERLQFALLDRSMSVDVTGTGVDAAMIVSAVATTGMQAIPWAGKAIAQGAPSSARWNRDFVWTLLSGGFLLLASVLRGVIYWWGTSDPKIEFVELCLLGLATLAGLRLVLPKAISSARRMQPDMNLLMTVAVIGAIVIGEYLEAASVAFLFALSNALETWSIRHAERAISALMDLTPIEAHVLHSDGSETTLPIEDVPVHSRIIVRPGERIPLDGQVITGTSLVNQAPITGESVPVTKSPGESVFAGTVNGNGALEVETSKAANDTTVAHIVRMVEAAQSQRSPSEQWVERFARIYTPAVMIVAVLVFLLPPLLFGQLWSVWFYRSLVLLVIACPCALVISTPVTIIAALSAAARGGVLIKGGLHLEVISRVRAIALDKTGTLTEGHPSLRVAIPLNGHTEAELLERVAALEARSEHPLARAILEYARSKSVTVKAAEEYQEIPGKGASGRWNGEVFWLGSVRLLRERGQQTPEIDRRIAELAEQGYTVVIVGNERHVCGLLALADTVRPTAKAALVGLKAAGVQHIVILTGDTQTTAQAIGRELGVDQILAELLPEDKVRTIQELSRQYGTVAMVGDGVNDAPALATANLGIAMGVAGSDAAIETADISLMSNDLTRLPWVFGLSRRAVSIIQQNIWFSILVKVAFALLAFSGYSTLWGAIAADTGASLLVTFNGLRLLRYDSR